MRKEQIAKPSSKPNTSDDSFNGDLTAQPQHVSSHKRTENYNPKKENIDYGKMNLRDAKISGYTDRDGNAVSMAKKDVGGSPTGAYTDIGAGRSSVVHDTLKKSPNK